MLSYQINTANEILDALIRVPPQDSSKSGVETKESVVNKMAAEMLEKLPAEYVHHEMCFTFLTCRKCKTHVYVNHLQFHLLSKLNKQHVLFCLGELE
ncbi:uncharacterized protein CEXT_268741 [Caerostris extrusa]|uniref:Uncharacterized protein n=1 Tax=Caerostris extrusa TaxID=172846 RepID=A0AAV4VZZ4_CAEEX|nr:uncharacterized protein CEXT_268741 [Caerostris extrusa]